MDYRVYYLGPREKGTCLLKAVVLSIVIAYLFYQHWLGLIFIPISFFGKGRFGKESSFVRMNLRHNF